MKLKGTLMKAGVVNGSGHMYPREVMEREIERYKKLIEEERAFGTYSQEFSDSVIRLRSISHVVTKMELEDDDVNVEIKVLDTPKGESLKDLIESKIPLRFGLSGVGSTEEGIVQEDYVLNSVGIDLGEPDDTQSIEQVRPKRRVIIVNEFGDHVDDFDLDDRALDEIKLYLRGHHDE